MSFAVESTPLAQRLIQLALLEDAPGGDLTSNLTIPPDAQALGVARAKEPGVLAGVGMMRAVFHALDPAAVFSAQTQDGQTFSPGDEIARVQGGARAILAAERTALNFVQLMSGIATETARYVDAVKPLPARVADSRKTIPGWRVLSKYAVRMGGGQNHRFSLSDGVLIKDNHIAVAGGVAKAVHAARKHAPHTTRIEVEVETLEQLREALDAKADIVLLDNMDAETLKRAVQTADGRALLEASGGVRLDNIRKIAETGVDVVSTSGMTAGAGAIDIHFKMEMIGIGDA